MPITRFAPSPTGYLHLGHAYSALFAARAAGPTGTFLLRIEDLDPVRTKAGFVTALEEDLRWLGLVWPTPVRRQSEQGAFYRAHLDRLREEGLLYPCFCTRTKSSTPSIAHAPHGPDPRYPGTCRALDPAQIRDLVSRGVPHALRLDGGAALKRTGPLTWRDLGQGTVAVDPDAVGDVVLARKDIGVSYHLAVTLDDDLQGVDLVTRGQDLVAATPIHRLLQALFDLAVPVWHHHALIEDENGTRLAKRAGSRSLRDLRADGITAAEIRRRLGFAEEGIFGSP